MWTCPKCGKQLMREDQHHFCIKPVTIDEYISIQDETVQLRLYQVRKTICTAIPDAEERISWQMPTFWRGRNIIHFAAFKKHIGIYPEVTEVIINLEYLYIVNEAGLPTGETICSGIMR